jgi:hypothetical protein
LWVIRDERNPINNKTPGLSPDTRLCPNQHKDVYLALQGPNEQRDKATETNEKKEEKKEELQPNHYDDSLIFS